jgi:hypothetical protein
MLSSLGTKSYWMRYTNAVPLSGLLTELLTNMTADVMLRIR